MKLRSLVAALVVGAAASCGGSDTDDLYGGGSGSGGGAGSCLAGCAGSATGGLAGGDAAAGSAGGPDAAATAGQAGAGATAGQAGAGATGGQAGSGGGGGTATPGTIQCGGAACSTDSSVCCTCPGCTIPFPTQCFPKLTGCTGTGKVVTCDDAADCAGGVCCAHFQPPSYAFTGATCESSCPDEGNAQLCSVDTECPDQRVCKPLASLPGFRACQPK